MLDIFIKQLLEEVPDSISLDVPLSDFSRWKVGGYAKCIFTPNTLEELIKVIKLSNQFNESFIVIGSTSNLLFSDEGLDILAINISPKLSAVNILGSVVEAQSGAWVPGFAKMLGDNGLSGLEHIIGIPGTLGGLVYMNGGSMRRGIGENIKQVKTITKTGLLKEYNQHDCEFSYRGSIFQKNNEIILEVTLNLENELPNLIKGRMLNILRSRRKKFPQKLPNCGSVFKSDPGMYEKFGPPGAIIERAGLKGVRKGGAMISPMHANFIVNTGGASATDILYLIKLAKDKVNELTGFTLFAEALFVEPCGKQIAAHYMADKVWKH